MPSKLQSILLGGVLIGVLSSLFGMIPVAGGCLVCIASIGSGLIAVWHYTTTYELTISGGQGAGMGALAGVSASVVAFILDRLLNLVGLKPDMQAEVMRGIEQSGMDPSQVESMRSFFESPAFIVVALLVGLLVGAILGLIGGAIGASMFKKGKEPAPGTDEF